MNNQSLLIILCLITGAIIPIQAVSNVACSKATGHPVTAALITLLIGTLTIAVYIFISKTPLPQLSGLKSSSPIAFVAGVIVAFYLIIITFITPKLGVGPSIGLIITGQLIGAVTIDHYGLFNASVRSMDVKRCLGVLFMATGIYLVLKK